MRDDAKLELCARLVVYKQSPALAESAKRRIGRTGGNDRFPPFAVIAAGQPASEHPTAERQILASPLRSSPGARSCGHRCKEQPAPPWMRQQVPLRHP